VSYSRRDLTRYVGFAAAGAVVVAPVALAVASWGPLEPAPRLSQADEKNLGDPVSEERRRPRDKDQKQHPKRDESEVKDPS